MTLKVRLYVSESPALAVLSILVTGTYMPGHVPVTVDGPHSRTMMRQACENLKSAVRWGNAQAQSLSQAVTVTHPGPGRGRRRGVRLRRGVSESSPDWRFFLFDHTFVA